VGFPYYLVLATYCTFKRQLKTRYFHYTYLLPTILTCLATVSASDAAFLLTLCALEMIVWLLLLSLLLC